MHTSQVATAAMSARASRVAHVYTTSCAHRMAAELAQLQHGWQQLHACAAAPDQAAALLHHLKHTHTQQHALQQEVARLRQAVLAQEVELGAFRGGAGVGAVKQVAEAAGAAVRSEYLGSDAMGGSELGGAAGEGTEVRQGELGAGYSGGEGQEDRGVQPQQQHEPAKEEFTRAAAAPLKRVESGSQWGEGCLEEGGEAQEECCDQGTVAGTGDEQGAVPKGAESCGKVEPAGEQAQGGKDAGCQQDKEGDCDSQGGVQAGGDPGGCKEGGS